MANVATKTLYISTLGQEYQSKYTYDNSIVRIYFRRGAIFAIHRWNADQRKLLSVPGYKPRFTSKMTAKAIESEPVTAILSRYDSFVQLGKELVEKQQEILLPFGHGLGPGPQVYKVVGFNPETTARWITNCFAIIRLQHTVQASQHVDIDYHTFLACKKLPRSDAIVPLPSLSAAVIANNSGGVSGGVPGPGGGSSSSHPQTPTVQAVRTFADGKIPREPLLAAPPTPSTPSNPSTSSLPSPSTPSGKKFSCAWSKFVPAGQRSPIVHDEASSSQRYLPFNAVQRARNNVKDKTVLVLAGGGGAAASNDDERAVNNVIKVCNFGSGSTVCRLCYNSTKDERALMPPAAENVCIMCLLNVPKKRGICDDCQAELDCSEAKQTMAYRAVYGLKYVYFNYDFTNLIYEKRVLSDKGGQYDKRYDLAVDVVAGAHKLMYRLEVIESQNITLDAWNKKVEDMMNHKGERRVFMVAYQPEGSNDQIMYQYAIMRHWLDAFIQLISLLPAHGVLLVVLGVESKTKKAAAAGRGSSRTGSGSGSGDRTTTTPGSSSGGSKKRRSDAALKYVTVDMLSRFIDGDNASNKQLEGLGLQHTSCIKRVLHLRHKLTRPVIPDKPVAFMCHPKECEKIQLAADLLPTFDLAKFLRQT